MRSRERSIDLYRVQIRGVWRQEQEPCTDIAQYLVCTRAFVAGQVVEDDHIALVQCRRELQNLTRLLAAFSYN